MDRLHEGLRDRYIIERALGEGGMAEVFLAHDVKHDRKVAVKVLRADIARLLGPDRFLKEIAVTARLSHPHILPLFDSGDADGHLFYVMPAADGGSLRDRLDRERQLPVDAALEIAQRIASALDYAHRQGVIHRDIKPENILFNHGEPVLTDFGIALAVASVESTRLTEAGASLGSPAYMSPEQATGDRELDQRSDVYALATVLYEMLAGDPPFTGSNVQALIARIIAGQPAALRELRPAVPASVDAAVARALSKIPADRFPSVHEFVGGLTAGAPHFVSARRSKRIGLAVAGAVGVALLAGVVWSTAFNGSDGPPLRLDASPEQITFTGRAAEPRVSPNGQFIAYLERRPAAEGGRLLLTDFGGAESIELAADTHLLRLPRWHPDGSNLLFFAGTDGRGRHQHGLYLVSRLGGERRLLRQGFTFPSYDWSGDGGRVGVVDNSLLYILDVATSTLVVDSVPLRWGDNAAEGVAWSPVGDWLVTRVTNPATDRAHLAIIDLEGTPVDSIVYEQGDVYLEVWARDGSGVYYSQADGPIVTFTYRPFNAATGRFRGDATTLYSDREVSAFNVLPGDSGIVFERSTDESHLYRFALDGTDWPPAAVTEGTATYYSPRISPDDRFLAYSKVTTGDSHLYLRPLEGGAERQLTFEGRIVREATWSPDGQQLAFGMATDSGIFPMLVPAAGGAAPRRIGNRLTGHGGWPGQFAWAPDGQTILYQLSGHGDFMLLDLANGTERGLLGGSSVNRDAITAVFSPDGSRIALHLSDPNTPRGIYVMDLVGGSRRLLARRFGLVLRWDEDDVIYFRDDRDIWAVSALGGEPTRRWTLPAPCDDADLSRDLTFAVCWGGRALVDLWVLRGAESPGRP